MRFTHKASKNTIVVIMRVILSTILMSLSLNVLGDSIDSLQKQADINNQFTALINNKIDSFKLKLHFDFDKAVLKEAELPQLDVLGKLLENSPLIDNIILTGHTDQAGIKNYNYELSQRRIDVVSDYLRSHYNLKNVTIYSKAYGEDRPLTPQPPITLKNMIDRRAEIELEISNQSYSNQVDFSSYNMQALTTLGNNIAVIWDVINQCPYQYLSGHNQSITVTRFSANGRLALTGSHDASLILWDTATGQKIYTLMGHTGSITDVQFLGENGTYAISSSTDKTLRKWNIKTGITEKIFTDQEDKGGKQGHLGHKGAVTSVAIAAISVLF